MWCVVIAVGIAVAMVVEAMAVVEAVVVQVKVALIDDAEAAAEPMKAEAE